MNSTLQEALAHWLALAAAGKRPATLVYHRELAKIFSANFPGLHRPVPDIGPADIAEFVGKVAHYSSPRFNALLGLLKALLPHAPKIPRVKVRPKAVELPGQAEFAGLLAELDQAPRGHAGLVVRFLALTGLRIGEARRLTWSHVRADGIQVPAEFNKTHRARLVPMVPGLPGVLERLRAVADGQPAILPQANVKTALKAACGRAGIRRLSHHDFRRLYATRCIECGVDMPTAARWLGHGDGGALLAKTYFQLGGEHSRAMAKKVNIAA